MIPFFYDSGTPGTYWTSELAQECTALGYQYDILQRQKNESDTDRRRRVAKTVTEKYPSTGTFLAETFNEAFLGPEPAPFEQGGFSDDASVPLKEAGFSDEEVALASPQEAAAQARAAELELDAQQPVAVPKISAASHSAHKAPTQLPQVLADNAARKGESGDGKKHRRLYPDYLVNILYDR